MKVRNDYVAIRKVKQETTLPNGLVISVNPDQEDYNEAVVLGVGPKVEDLNEGDRVLVSQYTGTRVERDVKDNIFFLKEDDVLAVITDD